MYLILPPGADVQLPALLHRMKIRLDQYVLHIPLRIDTGAVDVLLIPGGDSE